MSNIYNNIGYIGWTEDAQTLVTAVMTAGTATREQYVWCPVGADLPAGVTAVSTAQELAALCKTVVFTEGSDPAALEQLQKHITTHTVCGDLSKALPTEKYRRATAWESCGGFYVDVAYETSIADTLKNGKFYYSGRGAQLVYKSFYRILFPVYVPGEAGEATLLRMLRTTPAGTLSELTMYIEHFRKTCPVPQDPDLFSDKPENEGVANALRRAEQMSDVLWQPLKKFPKVIGLHETDDFSPEFPAIGLPYSSARMGEQYIGPNLSLETFFTALEEEDSVLYTRDLRGHGNAAAYYGTVCSVFVGNAIDLYTRVPCKLWPEIPGMRLIEPNCADSLQLGDTLLNATHVAMVTGIDRTADGKVYRVYVSESTHPTCRRKVWRADEFAALWLEASGFRIYRYDKIHSVPYTPCAYAPLADENLVPQRNRDLSLNFGNKVNCRLGEELAFRIKTPDWGALCIECDGKPLCRLSLSGQPQSLTYTPDTCGNYRAFCEQDDGTVSKTVEFAIVDCSIAIDKSVYRPGDPILATGTAPGGAKPECAFLIYDGVLNYRVKETQHIQWFTPEEQAAGKGIVSYDVPGPYMLKLFFRNRYGVYCSDYVKLEIKEGL